MLLSVAILFLMNMLGSCNSIKEYDILGYMRNGYIMDANNYQCGYYHNGYVLDKEKKVIGTYQTVLLQDIQMVISLSNEHVFF